VLCGLIGRLSDVLEQRIYDDNLIPEEDIPETESERSS
jgi:hypothetical protein